MWRRGKVDRVFSMSCCSTSGIGKAVDVGKFTDDGGEIGRFVAGCHGGALGQG